VLKEFHERLVGRHFGSNIIVKKKIGYWWPVINKYAINLCQKCDACQWLTPMW
jgi:hypothetical protein